MLSMVFGFWLPETKGLSIEEMDILFGSTTQEARNANIARLHKDGEMDDMSKEKDLEVEHVSLSFFSHDILVALATDALLFSLQRERI